MIIQMLLYHMNVSQDSGILPSREGVPSLYSIFLDNEFLKHWRDTLYKCFTVVECFVYLSSDDWCFKYDNKWAKKTGIEDFWKGQDPRSGVCIKFQWHAPTIGGIVNQSCYTWHHHYHDPSLGRNQISLSVFFSVRFWLDFHFSLTILLSTRKEGTV